MSVWGYFTLGFMSAVALLSFMAALFQKESGWLWILSLAVGGLFVPFLVGSAPNPLVLFPMIFCGAGLVGGLGTLICSFDK